MVGGWILVVQEVHHDDREPANRLVGVPTLGGEPQVLFDACDFVSSPRVDPGGQLLAFLSWDHPDMPWDATTLWVGELDTSLGPIRLLDAHVVAGGPTPGIDSPRALESICQPRWDTVGRLWFISDRNDWWNLMRFPSVGRPSGTPVVIAARAAEVGEPAWVFGQSRYDFLSDGRVVFASSTDGIDHLSVVDPTNGQVEPVAASVTQVSSLAATATTAVMVAATFTAESSVQATLVGRGGATGGHQLLRPPRDLGLSSAHLSVGQPITFPTGAPGGDRHVAHGLFYPPTNPGYRTLDGERPPLLVMIHGGPTSAARPELRLALQYWTSRGFAVVDVNYRGSTGFGRRFRDELRGGWGVLDVQDCVAAARFLADAGRVDGDRLLIRGGSAGGFTTLAALTFTDTFAAGASYYGIADLALLASDTHKFESRYLDGLVGPWPEAADVYAERSPLHHVDQLDRPVIVFQGLEDRVVPPNQAEAIVAALASRSVPHAYVPVPGEGHGFRDAANIRRTLDAEWSFYLQVLGIPHPADLERVVVTR